ncbi:MAG: hypothetical protein QM778_21010 [Myxococcales bacterium]
MVSLLKPSLLLLLLGVGALSLSARAQAQLAPSSTVPAVEATPVATPVAEPASAPALQPPPAPGPPMALDTGCRPGDCNVEARGTPPAAFETTAPGPAGSRPPPGTLLRMDGTTYEAPPAKKPRLPKLWAPITLTCIGATFLVPGVTILTIALIDRSTGGDGDPEDTAEYTTVQGAGMLVLSGAALTFGIIWLKRRKAERRRMREEMAAGLAGFSWGIMGAGARVTLRM